MNKRGNWLAAILCVRESGGGVGFGGGREMKEGKEGWREEREGGVEGGGWLGEKGGGQLRGR